MRLLLAILFALVPLAAEAACSGGLCGPNNIMSWTQPDGTTTATSWQVFTGKAPGVCNTGVAVVYQVSQLSCGGSPCVPNTPGPLTLSLKLSTLNLTNGTWYANVLASGPGGVSACNGETSFPFVGSAPTAPTGLTTQ